MEKKTIEGLAIVTPEENIFWRATYSHFSAAEICDNLRRIGVTQKLEVVPCTITYEV